MRGKVLGYNSRQIPLIKNKVCNMLENLVQAYITFTLSLLTGEEIMLRGVVDQNVNVREREIILGACHVQIPIVNTHSNLTVRTKFESTTLCLSFDDNKVKRYIIYKIHV